MLAILNPQYAFLEADYANPNLKQVISKLKDSSEMANNREQGADAHTNSLLNVIPPNLTLKVNSLSYFVSCRYLLHWNAVDRRGLFLVKSLNHWLN